MAERLCVDGVSPLGRVADPGTPELLIREMRAGDLPAVLGIETASFANPWSAATFRNLLQRRGVALPVAQAETGTILGYAVAWLAGQQAELGNFAVHPVARRQGVGARLLESTVVWARAHRVDSLFLEVRESNGAARRLYEKAGFQAVDIRPGYYSSPREAAVVMRLTPVWRSPR
ncbi:MAG: ribosomal protein S18-alanine N-acetyltransferase [Gemmatimonadota bacterium]